MFRILQQDDGKYMSLPDNPQDPYASAPQYSLFSPNPPSTVQQKLQAGNVGVGDSHTSCPDSGYGGTDEQAVDLGAAGGVLPTDSVWCVGDDFPMAEQSASSWLKGEMEFKRENLSNIKPQVGEADEKISQAEMQFYRQFPPPPLHGQTKVSSSGNDPVSASAEPVGNPLTRRPILGSSQQSVASGSSLKSESKSIGSQGSGCRGAMNNKGRLSLVVDVVY